MYSHNLTHDLGSLQSLARAERVSHSSMPARSTFTIEMQSTRAPQHGPGASLADMSRHRALHGNGRVLAQAYKSSSRHDEIPNYSYCADLTSSSQLSHPQRPPGHEHQSMRTGHSPPYTSVDACEGITCRAISTQKKTLVTERVSQPDIIVQQGAMQPNWWQHLSSIAAGCAMAALLTAGGPCSPAEARARLTQVNSIQSSDTLIVFGMTCTPYTLAASACSWLCMYALT